MSETLELSRNATALAFAPITPITGAEVTGVDLSGDLAPQTVAALRSALLKHKVLVFRDQPLDDANQIRFSRAFGRVNPRAPDHQRSHPAPGDQAEHPHPGP
jgi:taurine dioxygenase